MNDRFKFRIAVYERQQNDMPWVFVEYIDPDNQHWGLNQCGDIISDSSYSAHYTRKNAPDSVHRVYEPEMSTGLKDKNGKLIYEGDVVSNDYETGVVKYGDFNCSCCDGVYGWYFDGADIRDVGYYKIIGNIHEQPEQMGIEQ